MRVPLPMLLTLAGLLACAGGQRAAATSAAPAPGTYRFREVVPNSRGQVVEGVISVGDTIVARTVGEACRQEIPGRVRNDELIVFDCGNVQLVLSRLNFFGRSTYAVRLPQPRTRRVCDEYGARGCVRYSTETYEELAWVRSKLNLTLDGQPIR